jgi:thiol-disulfide isomerase/thioredoxin
MQYMESVPYLEESDFNSNMSLKPNVTNGKPSVVMCQSLGCGHCTVAKHAFAEFSKKESTVNVYTIQIDAERGLGNKLTVIDKDFRGVPCYYAFGSDGTFIGVHNSGRDTDSLVKFAKSLK